MQPRREQIRIGREKLQRIIELCKAIEERSLDPFTVDVDEIIQVIREYFPAWEKPEDLCLDAEAINRLASVIKLQTDWIRHRSTSLYTDPFLLEEKIRTTGKEELLNLFLKAWRPIVELEQISLNSLSEALRYWAVLSPLKDRWKDFPSPEGETVPASRDELISQKILGGKAFTEELENLWKELKEAVQLRGVDGKISYWDFVGAETYEETAYRAFMVSFLVTYGYATLEVRPFEEKIYIKPFEKPLKRILKKQLVSVPIVVSREEWERWRRDKTS